MVEANYQNNIYLIPAAAEALIGFFRDVSESQKPVLPVSVEYFKTRESGLVPFSPAVELKKLGYTFQDDESWACSRHKKIWVSFDLSSSLSPKVTNLITAYIVSTPKEIINFLDGTRLVDFNAPKTHSSIAVDDLENTINALYGFGYRLTSRQAETYYLACHRNSGHSLTLRQGGTQNILSLSMGEKNYEDDFNTFFTLLSEGFAPLPLTCKVNTVYEVNYMLQMRFGYDVGKVVSLQDYLYISWTSNSHPERVQVAMSLKTLEVTLTPVFIVDSTNTEFD